jgi:hypothetical protein
MPETPAPRMLSFREKIDLAIINVINERDEMINYVSQLSRPGSSSANWYGWIAALNNDLKALYEIRERTPR